MSLKDDNKKNATQNRYEQPPQSLDAKLAARIAYKPRRIAGTQAF